MRPLKIVRSTDCGNSPKNAFVEDLAIAMASLDVARLCEVFEPDLAWEDTGQDGAKGLAHVLDALKSRFSGASAIEVQHAISHGRVGMCNGRVSLSSGMTVSFCHVVEFSNAKGTRVRALQSYLVQA